jgi:O-antigen ligase
VLGAILCVIGVLLTYSRSSYLALIGGIAAFTVMKRQWLLLFAIAAFIIAIIYLPKTSGSTLDLFRADSTLARLGNWRQGVTLITQAPVFGHGFNMLRYVYDDSDRLISKAASGLDSSLLFVGATTGIIGILAYGYLLISMLRIGGTNAAYLSCFVALGIHSIFVNSAFYPWILIWFWILTGVIERVSGGKSLFS